MSTGWKSDWQQEEKILQEEEHSSLKQEKDSADPILEENKEAIPLKVFCQKVTNTITSNDSSVDSPTQEKTFRETIQSKTNVPQVHKTDLKKAKLVKQHTLSNLPEYTPEEESFHGKVLKKQNTVSGGLSSEGKFSPCSLSSDGDRLFIRVRTTPGNDFLVKSNTIYTSVKSLEKVVLAGSDSDFQTRTNGSGSRTPTSSGVGTSLVSLSGLGTSSAEGTTERPVSIIGYRPKSGNDFWSQVAQQVAFIDSSGNSNRNSLLLNCGHQIPPGVSW